MTIARTRAASAPSAMRTPISRVRCVTLNASMPYNPIAASTVASTANAADKMLIM